MGIFIELGVALIVLAVICIVGYNTFKETLFPKKVEEPKKELSRYRIIQTSLDEYKVQIMIQKVWTTIASYSSFTDAKYAAEERILKEQEEKDLFTIKKVWNL